MTRLRSLPVVGCVLASVSVGCASLFNLADYSIEAQGDASTADVGTANGGNPQGREGGLGPQLDAGPTSGGGWDGGGSEAADTDGAGEDAAAGDAAPPPGCVSNAQCAALAKGGDAGADAFPGDGGAAVSVCVRSTGTCASLFSPDCTLAYGDYLNDNAVLLGTLFATSGVNASANVARQQAALLAAGEINSSAAGGGLPPLTHGGAPRPLVILECDPTANAARAAEHLALDLRVPAIVGPDADQDVITVTQQVSADAGTVLITPSAVATPIAQLVDSGLTRLMLPSDAQRAKLLVEQVTEVAALLASRGPTLKLGVVYCTDVLGQSALASLEGTLLLNGQLITDPANTSNVSLDHYADATNVPSQRAIAVKYSAVSPDIVFITAPEQVTNVLVPLEQSLTLSNAPNHPYYVLDEAAKVTAVLSAASQPNVPADLRTRIRGIGVPPDSASASILAAFGAAYSSKYGSSPGATSVGTSYDAMYAIAYALAATPGMPLSGSSVAAGLASLSGGSAVGVGQGQAGVAMQTLASGKSISLRGTLTALQWSPNGDIAGGTAEAWCVGVSSGAPAFAGSGLTMDVKTQTISGSFTQCP